MDRAVLEDLVRKTAEFVPSEGRWKVYYLGFARGGWDGEAKEFAKEVDAQGETWQSVGMSLLDLARVDRDLKEWSQGKEEEGEIRF